MAMSKKLTDDQRRENRLATYRKANSKRKQYNIVYSEKETDIIKAIDKAIDESKLEKSVFLKHIIVDFLKNNGYLPL